MKAIFEFHLPDDKNEWNLHVNAGPLYCAVWDYAQWLRGVCKHGNPAEYDAEACREKLHEFLRDVNLEF